MAPARPGILGAVDARPALPHRCRRRAALAAAAPPGAQTVETINTVAGSGTASFGGDGDAAIGVSLNAPRDVAALPDGSFLIADTGTNRIRLVSPSGLISTVVGGEAAGGSGDGGPAAAALLNAPSSVAPLIVGGFLIADTGNNRIRRVDGSGAIGTVAGTGTAGFAGDGALAIAAQLNQPEGVAVRDDGSIFIGDTGNQRGRVVDTNGSIRTLAGTGAAGFSGDGGRAGAAQLCSPRGLSVSADRMWVADAGNHRIRQASEVATTPPPTANQRPPEASPPPASRRRRSA